MKKLRLDELVVALGHSPNGTQARALIMAGKVRHGTVILDKPGKRVAPDLDIEIIAPPRFVGRGGEKLDGLLEQFPIECRGKSILLQRGASHATCLDVGRGQLHGKIRADPRVINLEKVNARRLSAEQLPQPLYDIVTVDLSFISLRKVLPAIWPMVRPEGFLVALVKPQFEALKVEADRGRGVIRDPEVRERITGEIRSFATTCLPACHERACLACILPGKDGNRECFLVLQRSAAGQGL
jgi:23S rRNA (cytidine1920-2'-O)/16S rRNA (cytidine1409-2'-O)-methyltransferase